MDLLVKADPNFYKLTDLTGDYGLHFDVSIAAFIPEMSLRLSGFSDPDTDEWQWTLQKGSKKMTVAQVGGTEPQSLWTFTDEKGESFVSECID